jgi:hypothetical protein
MAGYWAAAINFRNVIGHFRPHQHSDHVTQQRQQSQFTQVQHSFGFIVNDHMYSASMKFMSASR